jgi:hypothetical protein
MQESTFTLHPEQYQPTGVVDLSREQKVRAEALAKDMSVITPNEVADTTIAGTNTEDAKTTVTVEHANAEHANTTVANTTVAKDTTTVTPHPPHTPDDEPLTDPADIAAYIRAYTGAKAPPLASWHYCGCTVVTKVKPKKSNKVMRKEAEIRAAKIDFVRGEAARMGISEDNPALIAEIEKLSVVPPRKEKPKTLDEPCDFKVKNRNAMRVHLRTIHSVYYCEYCRTRWNKPQKQKWKEHKMKYPSGQCRFLANGGVGPGKGSAGKIAPDTSDTGVQGFTAEIPNNNLPNPANSTH